MKNKIKNQNLNLLIFLIFEKFSFKNLNFFTLKFSNDNHQQNYPSNPHKKKLLIKTYRLT